MEYKISLSVEILIIDFLIWLIIKKIHKLETKNLEIIFSQLCTVAVLACYIFSNINIGYIILLKVISVILECLLITDSFKIKNLFLLFNSFIIFSLSVYGYYEFILLISKCLNLNHLINTLYFDAIFACFFVVFYILLYTSVSLFSKNRNLQSFLAEVSFFISDTHIILKGLIDSGNSFYDSKSGLPVVILSLDCLKKFMPLISFSYVNEILAEHCEKCVVVGGDIFYVPIVKVSACKIVRNGKIINKKFVIGVVEKQFYDEKHYECLLHRDFI